MQTIVLAARKGGCSKTTLAAHLAVEASKSRAVTLVDCDPQHSLTDWWNDREADTPALLEAPVNRLAYELQNARTEDGLVIIDTPPLDSDTISAVVALADMVVIPVKPSPHDLRGVGVTVDLVRNAGKPFVFVITQAIQRALITQEAMAALSEFGPVSASVMYYRVDYAASMTDGRTAPEIDGKGKASEEIASLWRYLSKQLNKPANHKSSKSAGEHQ